MLLEQPVDCSMPGLTAGTRTIFIKETCIGEMKKDLHIQKVAKGEGMAMKEIRESHSLTLAGSSLPFVNTAHPG